MPLWDERQPGEGSKAWAAFTTYRDLGAKRSITLAWRKFTNKESGESGSWELWARKYQWTKRAAEYDKYLDDRKRAEFEERLAELHRHQAELQFTLQRKIEKRIDKQEAILDKFDAVPATDVVRDEDQQVTVKEDGVIESKTTRTKIKGVNASAYARLSKEHRETMRQAVNGFSNASRENGSGSNDGLKELARAIRESPE